MARRRISQLVLCLVLLNSSCVWASDSARRSEHHEPGSWLRETIAHSISDSKAAKAWRIIEEAVESIEWEGHEAIPSAKESISSSSQDVSVEELQLRRRTPTEEEAARVTTAPSNPLVPRQAQSQIDQLNARIQSLQQSAQQALQSLSDASRQVSQASQQLSQSSQQLSQQSQQLSQQSQQLSQSVQAATVSIASLNGALTSARSSGSSAFASCTSSASLALVKASGDAATMVGAALAQATLARTEADREVQQAQGTAVSITQAAAAIVGTFIGSSLLTVLLVFIILRYRRKRRDNRDGTYDGGGRPGTSASYNSMAGSTAARDVKEPPTLSPGSVTTPTVVGSTAGRGPLPRLGIVREPTGGALTTEHPRTGDYGERKPLKLARPPPARKKQQPQPQQQQPGGGGGGGDDDDDKQGSGSSNHTWNLFPKVDPDPRGLERSVGAHQHGQQQQQQQQQEQRPGSVQQAANLQKWLQTATVSPFGPLQEKTKTAPPPPLPPQPSRLLAVKWPLQDSSSLGDETPTVELARSISMKGIGLPGKPRKMP